MNKNDLKEKGKEIGVAALKGAAKAVFQKENIVPGLILAGLVGVWQQTMYSNVPSLPTFTKTPSITENGNINVHYYLDRRYEQVELDNVYDLKSQELRQTWRTLDNKAKETITNNTIPFEDFTNRDWNDLEDWKIETNTAQKFPNITRM